MTLRVPPLMNVLTRSVVMAALQAARYVLTGCYRRTHFLNFYHEEGGSRLPVYHATDVITTRKQNVCNSALRQETQSKSISYCRISLVPRTLDCNTVTYQNTPQTFRNISHHKYGRIAHLRHIISSINTQNVSELPSVICKKLKDSSLLRHSVLFGSKLSTFRWI